MSDTTRRNDAYNVLLRNGAPPQAVARIIREMEDFGVFDVSDAEHDDEPREVEELATELAAERTTVQAVMTLAAELEASKSPAIKGAGRKLRAILDDAQPA